MRGAGNSFERETTRSLTSNGIDKEKDVVILDTTINVPTGELTDAEVLVALYNAAKPLGMGWLHYNPEPMTLEEAERELTTGRTYQQNDDGLGVYFDYLNGRVMKVRIGEGEFDPRLYDRDNGEGAARAAIEAAIAAKGTELA